MTVINLYKDTVFCMSSLDGRCTNVYCHRFFDDDDRKQSEGQPTAFRAFWDGCEEKRE